MDRERQRIIPQNKRIINQGLIDELNELFANIKIHLFDLDPKLKANRPKPTIEEIDTIHAKVDQVLILHKESYIKH